MQLVLQDNAYNGISLKEACIVESNADYQSIYNDLSYIANKNVKELLGENSLIYFGREKTEIDTDSIFELSLVASNDGIDGYKNARIRTGNIAGFIQKDETQITINSRFYDKICDADYFLYYLLLKLNNINLVDLDKLSLDKDDQILNLLILAFPHLLNNAFKFGIFKTYRTFEYDNSRVKGQIDISRFIKNDIPFAGKISYKFREFTADNYLLQLVRHTIEYIKQTQFRNILSQQKIRDNVRICIESTPSYKKSERVSIIQKNLKATHHPYYRAYTALQHLCLMILQGKKTVYNSNNSANRLSGIIFDVSYLWEEYLATILKNELAFKHPENRDNKGGIRMFDKSTDNNESNIVAGKLYRKIYPDFYRKVENNPNKSFILDAKYKKLDDKLYRDDIYQIVTYMHTMEINNGGFIYPSSDSGKVDPTSYKLSGYGGLIYKISFPIPQQQNSFANFKQVIEENEKLFIERIKNCEIN